MAKVLSVDDSIVVRSMVAKHLKPYGCELVEAADGEQGVAAARREHPDLILLAVTMPIMDGLQALTELRKDETLKAMPVVMLTAANSTDVVDQIAKLDVDGYIVKPFTKATFDAAVSKVLGSPAKASAEPASPRDDGCELR